MVMPYKKIKLSMEAIKSNPKKQAQQWNNRIKTKTETKHESKM